MAVQDTLAAFEKREGVEIITQYNGCGILVGEMKTGKLPDAYLACDNSYMDEVEDLFLDRLNVAETDIVILVPKGNPKNIQSLEDLAKPGIRVAVTNPKYSALGGLTVQMLEKANLRDAVLKNVTYGDAPTADFLTMRVKTGREDAAIVYRANTVHLGDDVEVVEIDLPFAKAVQPISIEKDSKYKHTLTRLVSAIRSADSKEKYTENGFRWRGDD
jgi:molybdenum ABC transporter molybdate-binding protein